jgi:hypothetical protein
MVAFTVIPDPGIGRKNVIWGKSWAKMQDPIQKLTKAKLAGGVAQMRELLSSKDKALCSSPSTTHTHTHTKSNTQLQHETYGSWMQNV